jgi:sensor histidine kinase YesM
MSWHDFIFSDRSKYRLRRHLTCWLLWWTYIVFTVFITSPRVPDPPRRGYIPVFTQHQPGLNELGYFSYSLLVLLKSFLLVSFHVLFCYAIIYILLPAFQKKRNYWKFIPGILLVCILMVPVGYFLYNSVYPFIDDLFKLNVPKPYKQILWKGIDAGLINAIKVTLIAIAITLLKRWWVKQKEKEQLEKERINAEVQLLKAQIHPAFLFSTLNNITSEARVASPKAPEMLIKLSDLLSYMLYECDAPKVKLEREITMLKEYIALEKIRQGERLELTFQINGDLNGQMISPLVLLPFIDNSFSYCNHELAEQVWVNLDITVENKNLSLKIINGIPAGLDEDAGINSESMGNIQKRLNLLYPGKHELKINAEQELLMIHLNLKLEESTSTEQTIATPSTPILTYA